MQEGLVVITETRRRVRPVATSSLLLHRDRGGRVLLENPVMLRRRRPRSASASSAPPSAAPSWELIEATLTFTGVMVGLAGAPGSAGARAARRRVADAAQLAPGLPASITSLTIRPLQAIADRDPSAVVRAHLELTVSSSTRRRRGTPTA